MDLLYTIKPYSKALRRVCLQPQHHHLFTCWGQEQATYRTVLKWPDQHLREVTDAIILEAYLRNVCCGWTAGTDIAMRVVQTLRNDPALGRYLIPIMESIKADAEAAEVYELYNNIHNVREIVETILDLPASEIIAKQEAL